MSVNWQRLVGATSVALATFIVAAPIPDNIKVYLIAAEMALNGAISVYYPPTEKKRDESQLSITPP